MARIHTHYDNLKVARNAPPEIIRAAYKALSQKYHPDRNPGNPNDIRIIQMINLAYEVLSDPVKRQEHDEWIARSEGTDKQEASGAHSIFSGASAHSTAAETSHRRSGTHVRRSRRRSSSSGIFWPFEKMRSACDQFFRLLFRKI